MNVKVTVMPPQKWWDRTKYRTEEPVTMRCSNVIVPAGFVTDGATVPRWSLAISGIALIFLGFHIMFESVLILGVVLMFIPIIFPPVNQYMSAAIIHDYFLSEGVCSRRNSDKIFFECLRELRVKPWRRWSMYVAVRVYSIMKGGK